MIVCYILTRNLYPYLLPSIMSLLDHNDVETIYIFCEDDELPYELPKQCRVVNVTDQQWFLPGSANYYGTFTWIVNLRVCLSKLLPDVSRVIVLDIDTIICDSLLPIWEADLQGNPVMMAKEETGSYKPFGPDYYNSGVVVQDLDLIRKEGVDDLMIQLLSRIRYPYADQDAWNVICHGRITDMPVRFNETTCTGITEDPAIVHYAGVRRHWEPNVFRSEYYQKYKRYQRD